MNTCDVCGNHYDKTFTLTQGDRSGTFDSFECAIQGFAPLCEHCGCRIIGHGSEMNGHFFCCAHCAEEVGVDGLSNRVRAEPNARDA